MSKPLTNNDREQLRALLQRQGERATLAGIRISRSALHRALAGLPVSEGTCAIIQRDLARTSAA